MSKYQQHSPTVLIVEPDDKVRPALTHNLRRRGYRVVVSLDVEDACDRVRNGGIQVDVILLNQMERSIEQMVDIGRSIRQSAQRSTNTSIVITAERYGPDLEGQDVKVGERAYVTYLEDGQQLMNLLHNLCTV